MPYADITTRRSYYKRYREAHRAFFRAYGKAYRTQHKQKAKMYAQKYYEIQKRDTLWRVKQYERSTQSYRKLKSLVLTHYGQGQYACVRCGFDDWRALSIDHIKDNGGEHRRLLKETGTGMYRWLKNNNFPDGYQTLCMNCQSIKRQELYESKSGRGQK